MDWTRGKIAAALTTLGLVAAVAIGSFIARPATPDYRPPAGLQRSLQQARDEQIKAATPTTVLFVGDSYTAGGGGIDGSDTFAGVFCRDWKWQCWMDAEGGTGFRATGMKNSKTFTPYQGRLEQTKKDLRDYKDPMYIVVSGGRNDYGLPGVGKAADDYLAALDHAFPKSTVIVLLPFWQSDPAATAVATMRRDVKAAAVKNGAHWVSTTAWLKPSLMGPDGVHPTKKGHRRIAERFEAWMQAHGARSRAADQTQTDDDTGRLTHTNPSGAAVDALAG